MGKGCTRLQIWDAPSVSLTRLVSLENRGNFAWQCFLGPDGIHAINFAQVSLTISSPMNRVTPLFPA
jgi:hypothetical protein